MSETLFNLPLQPSIHWDDIRDNSGELVIQVYGDERHEATKAQRDYVIRVMNAYDDMLAALKAFSLFSAMIGKDGRPSWFKDDDAWTEYVNADEYRIAAIAKAGTQ